jgi:hypothetical protein
MSDYRNKLIEQRERQLAGLREKTGKFEQLTLDFACAAHDEEFRIVFMKRPQASRYVCEKIERTRDAASILDRLQGVFSGDKARTFSVDEVDLRVPCACCGARGWTLCNKCGVFVCSHKTKGDRFHCRESCGRQFLTGPLTEFTGSTGAAPSQTPAIGYQGAKRLPLRSK